MMGEVPEPLSTELLAGLDVALNEAELHDVVVRSDRAEAAVLIEVLNLPEIGPEPAERRVLLRLTGVGRVVASLRHHAMKPTLMRSLSSSLPDQYIHARRARARRRDGGAYDRMIPRGISCITGCRRGSAFADIQDAALGPTPTGERSDQFRRGEPAA